MPFPNISRNPLILGGKPAVTGTRISVEQILNMISSGMSETDIVSEYPRLTDLLVREAVAFAAVELNHTTVEAFQAV
jgi:uncharacterized protein (DUF433 family)